MRIKQGFKLRSLGEEHIIIAESAARADFGKIIALNSSAACLWQELQGKDFSAQTAAQLLEERFEVREAQALSDAKALLDKWLELGLISEE